MRRRDSIHRPRNKGSGAWPGRGDAPDLERGEGIRAQGGVPRQLHAWLEEKDPSLIVGLPDAPVNESRDRVGTARDNCGFRFPMGKTTINPV